MNEIKRIGLVYDKRNRAAKKLALEVAEWLKDAKVKNRVYSTAGDIARCDMVVTFGGDGTVLHTANKILRMNAPILRVNFGTRGCLCNVKADKWCDALQKFFDGGFFIEEKTRIRARNDEGLEVDALNEILIGGINYRNSWLEVRYEQAGKSGIFRATGDGLLFATQNGSTAWNSSAGGPQLLADVFCVTGSNAAFESDSGWVSPKVKSLVAPLETVFKVTTLRSGPYLPYVVADSQRHYRFKKDDAVIIEKSPYKTLFMELR